MAKITHTRTALVGVFAFRFGRAVWVPQGSTMMRRFLVSLGLLVALFSAATPITARAQSTDSPLDARLGGTRDSFEAKYGKPASDSDASSESRVHYEVKGYSDVFIDLHEERITRITLYSDRSDAASSRSAGDDADWSVKKAHELARRFAPTDVTFADPSLPIDDVIYRNGGSNAIANEVPADTYAAVDDAPQPGGFQVVLHLTDGNNVSWLELGLKILEIPTAADSGGPSTEEASASAPEETVAPAVETADLGTRDNPAPIGTTLNVEGQDITVLSAYVANAYGFSTPKGGHIYLVIEVSLVNVDAAKKDHGYRYDRFAAVDLDTGADYDDTFILADGMLDSGSLSTTEYVSGTVVLEIQDTSHRIRIKYDANRGGGSEFYWLFEY